MWSPCARSRAPLPQRSLQRSQAQSTSAGGKRTDRRKRGGLRGGIRQEVRILRDVCGSVKSIEGKRQEGKTEGKVGREINEDRRKEWTEIRNEK